MQGSFSVLSIKLYRMLCIGITKAANALFQQKRGDLYFAENGFIKPKSGAKRRKVRIRLSLFGSPNVNLVLQNLRSLPFGWASFLLSH